jgi:hypothetical protein
MRRERSRRSKLRGMTAARVIAILAAVGCCLAAAAYATTTRPAGRGSEEGGSRPLRPRIVLHPETVTAEPTAEFDFAAQGRPPRRAKAGPRPSFECKLDDDAWAGCVGPLTLRGIARGTHTFAVRTVNQAGNEGPATSFAWRRTRAATPPATAPSPTLPPAAGVAPTGLAPGAPAGPGTGQPVAPPSVEPVEPPDTGLPFTIEQIGSTTDLQPGGPALPIGVRITNPNPSPISVVSLTGTIDEDPPECPALENFVLAPAAVSAAAPFVVPAESTLAMPAEIDPTIAMIDLPTSQDTCQEAVLQIDLSGEATG